jgi:hypothetical protein
MATQLRCAYRQEGRFLVVNFRLSHLILDASCGGLGVGPPTTALPSPLDDHPFIYDECRI